MNITVGKKIPRREGASEFKKGQTIAYLINGEPEYFGVVLNSERHNVTIIWTKLPRSCGFHVWDVYHVPQYEIDRLHWAIIQE